MQKSEAFRDFAQNAHARGPHERRERFVVVEAVVQAASGEEFVYEKAVGALDAVAEEAGEVGVMDAGERLHLRAEFAEALGGGEVGGEALDGDGDAGREDGFVNEAEGAVAEDAVRGEVLGGGREVGEGDMGEGGVEREAVFEGGGNGDGEEWWRAFRGIGAAEDEDEEEEKGDGGEAGDGGYYCLEDWLH